MDHLPIVAMKNVFRDFLETIKGTRMCYECFFFPCGGLLVTTNRVASCMQGILNEEAPALRVPPKLPDLVCLQTSSANT